MPRTSPLRIVVLASSLLLAGGFVVHRALRARGAAPTPDDPLPMIDPEERTDPRAMFPGTKAPIGIGGGPTPDREDPTGADR